MKLISGEKFLFQKVNFKKWTKNLQIQEMLRQDL